MVVCQRHEGRYPDYVHCHCGWCSELDQEGCSVDCWVYCWVCGCIGCWIGWYVGYWMGSGWWDTDAGCHDCDVALHTGLPHLIVEPYV